MLPALVFAASLLLVVQAEGASLNASLAVAIEAIINQPQYEGCRWGVLARRTTTEDSLDLVYESAGAHLFSVPASNNKLPTTYAAWLALGPDYAFKTSLSVDGGAGDGNATTVTLCGANDPSLTSAQLQAAAAAVVLAVPALASSSNSAVTVRVDNRRSADALFPDSWEWEDLEFDYGAPPASVILDGNTVRTNSLFF
jgi:D-alanyl-D-alanine carboxypeptidase/D-alanyl-D-alanine-endopeptidase (penicillin-binding protein 4)